MQWYFLLLTVVSISKTLAVEYNGIYPPFAQCNEKVLSAIKAYWSLTGTPSKVLKTLNPDEKHFVYATTYNYKNENTKCAYLKGDKSTMNVTFIQKDNSPDVVFHYNIVHNEDGSITGTPTDPSTTDAQIYTWYTVHIGSGLAINYACSKSSEDVQQPPVIVFWVSKDTFKNPITKNILNTVYTLVETWGLNFTYNYKDACFPDTPEPTRILPNIIPKRTLGIL